MSVYSSANNMYFLFQIWSLAVSPNARFVVSSGHDKTIRLWERTEEVLVLEDERETEREREEDDELATGDSRVIPGQAVSVRRFLIR